MEPLDSHVMDVDHKCWEDGTQALIRTARQKMFEQVSQNPSQSIHQIYEEVRLSFTQNMTSEQKLLFLHSFTPLRTIAPQLYAKRREHIPADPKVMTDFNVGLEMFKYNEEDNVCIGDIVLDDRRRILLFKPSSSQHR